MSDPISNLSAALGDRPQPPADWERYCRDLVHLFGAEDLLAPKHLGIEGSLEAEEIRQRLDITDREFQADAFTTAQTFKPPTWTDHQSRRTWRELQRLQALRRGGGT